MRIILIIILVFSWPKLKACDGCNISTGFINVDPVNYLSLRHRNVYYKGEEIPFFRHTGHGGQLSENYLSHEFIAKYFIHNRVYIQTLISIKESIILSKDIDEKLTGFADPIFLIGFQNLIVLKKWQLNYNFFGGLDFGVGKYNRSLHEEYSPGSKTTDLLVGSEIFARIDKWAFISKTNYKMGFVNSYGYQFGQVLNTSFYSGYYYEIANLRTVPLLGISLESDFSDYKEDQLVRFSSSAVLFADFGLNFMFNKKIILGAKYKIPVFKNVPGWTDLQLDAFEFEISFVLGN